MTLEFNFSPLLERYIDCRIGKKLVEFVYKNKRTSVVALKFIHV